jgi:hypothetical protein
MKENIPFVVPVNFFVSLGNEKGIHDDDRGGEGKVGGASGKKSQKEKGER